MRSVLVRAAFVVQSVRRSRLRSVVGLIERPIPASRPIVTRYWRIVRYVDRSALVGRLVERGASWCGVAPCGLVDVVVSACGGLLRW